jgi:hypothetical protein
MCNWKQEQIISKRRWLQPNSHQNLNHFFFFFFQQQLPKWALSYGTPAEVSTVSAHLRGWGKKFLKNNFFAFMRERKNLQYYRFMFFDVYWTRASLLPKRFIRDETGHEWKRIFWFWIFNLSLSTIIIYIFIRKKKSDLSLQ